LLINEAANIDLYVLYKRVISAYWTAGGIVIDRRDTSAQRILNPASIIGDRTGPAAAEKGN
jgi:hypothetical protein